MTSLSKTPPPPPKRISSAVQEPSSIDTSLLLQTKIDDNDDENSIDTFIKDLNSLSFEDIVQKHTKSPTSPTTPSKLRNDLSSPTKKFQEPISVLTELEKHDDTNISLKEESTPVFSSSEVGSPNKSKKKNKKSKKDKKSKNKSDKNPKSPASQYSSSAVGSPTSATINNQNISINQSSSSVAAFPPSSPTYNPIMNTPSGSTASSILPPMSPMTNGTSSPAPNPEMNLNINQINIQLQQLQQILIPNIVQRTQQLTQQRMAYVNQLNMLQQQPVTPEIQQNLMQLYQMINNINQQLIVNQNQFNMAQQQIKQFQQIQQDLLQNNVQQPVVDQPKQQRKPPSITERTHSMRKSSSRSLKSHHSDDPKSILGNSITSEPGIIEEEIKNEENKIDYKTSDLNSVASKALIEEEKEKEKEIDYESIDLNAIAKAALLEEEEKSAKSKNRKSLISQHSIESSGKASSKRLSTASSRHSKSLEDDDNENRSRPKSRNSNASGSSRSRSRSKSKTRNSQSSKLRNDISKEIDNETPGVSESDNKTNQSPSQKSSSPKRQSKIASGVSPRVTAVTVPVNTNNAPPPPLPKRQVFMTNNPPASVKQSPKAQPVIPSRGISVTTGAQPLIPSRVVGASQPGTPQQVATLNRVPQKNNQANAMKGRPVSYMSPGPMSPPQNYNRTSSAPGPNFNPNSPSLYVNGGPAINPRMSMPPMNQSMPMPGQPMPMPGQPMPGQPMPQGRVMSPMQNPQGPPMQSPKNQPMQINKNMMASPKTQSLQIPPKPNQPQQLQKNESNSSIASFDTDGDIDINDSTSVNTEQMNNISFNRRPTFKRVNKKGRPVTTIRLGGSNLAAFNQTLNAYRQNVKNASDPILQFNYAKFLIDAANTEFQNDKEFRENLLEEGYRFLKKLSNNGYPEAQNYLATFYINDNDWDKALPLLVQAAKHNHGPSCYEVGQYYERRHDNVKANQYYKKAASNNSTEGMHRLGVASLRGELGNRKDLKNAVKWFKRALNNQNMDEGCGKCAFEMGKLYEVGYPPVIYQDDNYALELYVQGAELNNAESQYKLGECFERGYLGCPVDAAQSIHWYTVSSEGGDARAQFALAGWFLTGAQGVIDSNDQEAYRYCLLSANQEYPKAEYALGYFYEMGIGIEANQDESHKWYKRAADHGDKRAIDKINGTLISHKPSYNKKDRRKYIEENQQDCIIA